MCERYKNGQNGPPGLLIVKLTSPSSSQHQLLGYIIGIFGNNWNEMELSDALLLVSVGIKKCWIWWNSE